MSQMEKDVLEKVFAGIPKGGDVLLIVSPITLTRGPLYSVHLLQEACRSAGITVGILYSNLLYSTITGPKLHHSIAVDDFLLISERLFAASAFGIPAVSRYLDKISDLDWIPDHIRRTEQHINFSQVPEAVISYREGFNTADWIDLESRTTQWVQLTARKIVDMGFPLVGCSTSFGGLTPPVALLNCVKKIDSAVITVLGGSMCEADMAEGILSLKSNIDYIFSGEGDVTFPDFIRDILAGRLPKEKIIYGEPVTNLDTVSLPDYRDYFEQLKKSPDLLSPEHTEIPYETSRGCWYGKCTFCGFNKKKNVYREKSPERVLNDLKKLIEQYGADNTYMLMDNIMPPAFFDTLLPRMSREIPFIHIISQINANLTLGQVLSLKKAGVKTIVPGIESFSPSLLRRMRKGVTVQENIALLRYARSVKLNVIWLVLFDFPGDSADEYEEMLRLFPLIRHLPPPYRMNPMIIQRFSRYQRFPEAFNISNLRPAEIYEDLFPPDTHLEKIAYYFSGDFPARSHEHPEIIIALAKEIEVWKKAWAVYEMVPLEMMLPTLHITKKNNDEYTLEDTRGLAGRPERMVLTREQANILLIPRPRDSSADFQWAVDAQLGVLLDSWFIPLATAEPELLLEFERDEGR